MNEKYIKSCYSAKWHEVFQRANFARREMAESIKAWAELNRIAREFFGNESEEAKQAKEFLELTLSSSDLSKCDIEELIRDAEKPLPPLYEPLSTSKK